MPTELTAWPVPGLRRVSVNSFGFGGTNAHAVIDDAAHYLAEAGMAGRHNTFLFAGDKLLHAADSPQPRFSRTQLYVFSARDEAALKRVLAAQAKYIADNTAAENFTANYAYTLFSRRSRLDCATFAVAQSGDELLRKIKDSNTAAPVGLTKRDPRVAWVFCGQGAQWHAMGRELMAYDVFGSCVTAASNYMQAVLGSPFCLEDELGRDKETSRINEPQIAQPAVTAIQIALVDVLRAANLEPAAVVGHSSGEIGAAYAAGFISREDAWKVAYHRGRLAAALVDLRATGAMKVGAMLAVPLSEEDVQHYIHRAGATCVDVACLNGPASVTISGDEDEIVRIQSILAADKFQAPRVKVTTAYHSRHMWRIEDEYRSSIRDVQPVQIPSTAATATTTAMYSSVYGRQVTADELNHEYWVQNLVMPVQFFKAVSAMAENVPPEHYGRSRAPSRVDRHPATDRGPP